MEHGADIGESLRAERERLGLTLAQAEADTRIRTRYLAALEEERFDDLPGEAYVRGFLRCYATYLGLDGAAYLALYRRRVSAPEPAIAPARPPASVHVRLPSVVLAAALTALAALALGAWKLDDRRGDEPIPTTTTPPHPESVLARPAPSQRPAPAPAPAPRPTPQPPAVLVLTARGGTCWLDVRIGGPEGRRAWRGTLEEGRTLRLGLSRPLFIRAGAAHNLQATIGGESQRLQPGVVDLVATRQGLRRRT